MADIGYGVQLWVGADTAAVTATLKISDVTGITPPGYSVDEIDVTNADQTDYVRRFIPGLVDPGTIQLELDWLPNLSTADALITTMILARETRYMEVRFTKMSPTVKISGRGFFTELTPATAIDGKMTATATIRAANGVWVKS